MSTIVSLLILSLLIVAFVTFYVPYLLYHLSDTIVECVQVLQGMV